MNVILCFACIQPGINKLEPDSRKNTLRNRIYNIEGVLPYLNPIGVIMVHFSTYARPCVHKMTFANQTNSGFRRLVFTKFPHKWKKIVKNYLIFFLGIEPSPIVLCTTVNIGISRNPSSSIDLNIWVLKHSVGLETRLSTFSLTLN